MKEKISYAFGLQVGEMLKQVKEDVDLNLVMNGMKDTMEGKPGLNAQQIQQTMQEFEKYLGEKNTKAANDFLAQNKTKEGIVETKSGLQYKILTEGKGEKPKSSDTVTVHYRGTLVDGSEFDNSYARKEPATFPVTGVIPGWTEALQLMPVGSKWQLYIPPQLAYGERGAPGRIPPNSTLIFEVELIAIGEAKDAQK